MKYDKDKIVPKVLELLQKGMSLREACKGEGMPAPSTFNLWCNEDSKLAEQYARAREIRAELIFEEVLEIADDAANDYIETDEGAIPNRTAIDRARLKIDARKWVLGKMNPKKFGDKVTQEHTGEGGGAIQITIKDMS